MKPHTQTYSQKKLSQMQERFKHKDISNRQFYIFITVILLSIYFLSGCTTLYCHKIGATTERPDFEYHCICGDLEETWFTELSFDKTEGYKKLIAGKEFNHFKMNIFSIGGIRVTSYIPRAFGKQSDCEKRGWKKETRWKFTRK